MTCFYVSNVEFYLFNGGRWDPYVRNVGSLPHAANALIIRSYARFWRPGATPVPSYYMQTTVEPIDQFLADEKAGKNKSYWSLISSSGLR